MTGEKPEELCP